MVDNKVIKIIRTHVENQFPMNCSMCNHRFASLKEYVEYTIQSGKPISYDADRGNWRPLKPFGTFSLRNCQCGTTLSLSSHGMRLATLWRLLQWGKKESLDRGITVSELLDDIRKKIDYQVLSQKETEPNSRNKRGQPLTVVK